jgi:hypothetical protein
LIPLAEITAADFFALINWRNQPDLVRHPVEEPVGFDHETLTLSERVPFHGIGHAKESTVAGVMAKCVWE